MLRRIDENINIVSDGYINLTSKQASEGSTHRVSVGGQARRITKLTEHFRGVLDGD